MTEAAPVSAAAGGRRSGLFDPAKPDGCPDAFRNRREPVLP